MSSLAGDVGSDGATHWHEERRAIVVNAIGVGVAVAAYGVSFGAISATGGLSVLQTQFLSALMFTGLMLLVWLAKPEHKQMQGAPMVD